MKTFIQLTILTFVLAGCIGQKEEPVSGRFFFPNTSLSVLVPQGWLQTKIPGNIHPILFSDIQYGIKPNIKLEIYSSETDKGNIQDKFFRKMEKIYPDYFIESQQECPFEVRSLLCKKIKAKRTNRDNTPIIHTNYVLSLDKVEFIISATCAEPSQASLENIFDNIVKSVEINN